VRLINPSAYRPLPASETWEINESLNVTRHLLAAYFRIGSRVVRVLDSGAEGPGFKSQPRRRRVTVLGKLLTPIVRLFTKQ